MYNDVRKISNIGLKYMEHSNIGYKEVLKQKNYIAYITANIVNRFGDSIDSIALTWLVYMVSGSAMWSAVIFGVNRLPTVLFQPFLGVLVEKMNKKNVIVITDIIRGLCIGYIATAVFLNTITTVQLLIITIIISTAEAFRMPASSAILPELLDKQYYEHGIALESSLSSTVELVGLAVAGGIIAFFGVYVAIYLDMITFFASAVIVFFIKIKKKDYLEKEKKVTYFEQLKEGFGVLGKNKLLIYTVVLGVFLNAILTPFNALQAVMVSEILHSNEIMISIIGIFFTVGAILGSIVYPLLRKKIGKLTLISISGYSITLIYLGSVLIGKFVTNDFLVIVFISLISLITGMSIALLNTFTQVEFMSRIDVNFLARTKSIMIALSQTAIPVMSFVVSFLALSLSAEIIFVISGLLNVIICLVLCNKRIFNNMVNE